MKFLAQVQADLKRAVVEHQRDLIVQVLQGRSGELTLGDLRTFLASPLGRGLDDVRVATLFTATPSTPGKSSEAAPSRRRARTARAKPTTVNAERKPKMKTWPKAKLVEAVFATLQSSTAPISSTQIAAKLRAHRSTVRDLLQKLSEARRIVISGSRQGTRYALASAQQHGQPEAQTGKKRSRKTAASAKPKRAETPAVLSQADYDFAVLANLRAIGAMSSSQLQASVGGTLNEVRAALQRLISTQEVQRVGQHRHTRYLPLGPKPAQG